MSLEQGPQSSAKGKEVAEEIVMVVYSRSGQQFDITAKELANFKWLDKKLDEDPSFKEQVNKKLAKHLAERYNAYSFHQAKVCLAEAAQHRANAEKARAEKEQARAEKEQARQSKEAHLAKVAQLDASIKKDEAFIAAEQQKMESLKKESAVLQQEIDDIRSQRAEKMYELNDCQNRLLFARQEHIKTLTKEAMAQQSGATPPRSGITPPCGLRT